MSRADDERRSAALLLGPGGEGRVAVPPAVRAAVRSRIVPPAPVRIAQRLAMKRGRLGYLDQSLEPMAHARRTALGEAGEGPPRLLVRVDEFPRAGGFDHPETVAEMMRFHEIMSEAGVPYLLAVTPRVALDYLDPDGTLARALRDDEADALARLAADGVTFALHGLDHRTRRADPRRHSELSGLGAAALAELLDEGLAILARLGVWAPVFVPPFNRFDAGQYAALAARFDVVCGGPETVALLGWHGAPLWRGDAVYLPAYPPLYDRSGPLLPAVRDVAERAPGAVGAARPAPALGGRRRLGRPRAAGARAGPLRGAVGGLPRGRDRVARVGGAQPRKRALGGERRSRMLRVTMRVPPPLGLLQPHGEPQLEREALALGREARRQHDVAPSAAGDLLAHEGPLEGLPADALPDRVEAQRAAEGRAGLQDQADGRRAAGEDDADAQALDLGRGDAPTARGRGSGRRAAGSRAGARGVAGGHGHAHPDPAARPRGRPGR